MYFKITDEGRNVFAVEVPEEQLDDASRRMYSHIRTLIAERDGYVEVSIPAKYRYPRLRCNKG